MSPGEGELRTGKVHCQRFDLVTVRGLFHTPRVCLLGFHRMADGDDIETVAGQTAADDGPDPATTAVYQSGFSFQYSGLRDSGNLVGLYLLHAALGLRGAGVDPVLVLLTTLVEDLHDLLIALDELFTQFAG